MGGLKGSEASEVCLLLSCGLGSDAAIALWGCGDLCQHAFLLLAQPIREVTRLKWALQRFQELVVDGRAGRVPYPRVHQIGSGSCIALSFSELMLVGMIWGSMVPAEASQEDLKMVTDLAAEGDFKPCLGA